MHLSKEHVLVWIAVDQMAVSRSNILDAVSVFDPIRLVGSRDDCHHERKVLLTAEPAEDQAENLRGVSYLDRVTCKFAFWQFNLLCSSVILTLKLSGRMIRIQRVSSFIRQNSLRSLNLHGWHPNVGENYCQGANGEMDEKRESGIPREGNPT